ncbi:uncharacterized protein CEXT_614881 [Caerostris extrusa]|uniref:Uncharacterized protein n=1 Tax=Caerostris extrusa TaxID=172846 RepID=A0AAV4WCI3_CAEEX|nr:uncharacterized protein CEXT_614881 [Caerostris extrusa]
MCSLDIIICLLDILAVILLFSYQTSVPKGKLDCLWWHILEALYRKEVYTCVHTPANEDDESPHNYYDASITDRHCDAGDANPLLHRFPGHPERGPHDHGLQDAPGARQHHPRRPVQEGGASVHPARGPPASLANLGGFGTMASIGSLRTVMMGGMLYGLSLIPAVVLALGGNGLPFGGMLSALGMKKRALPETSSAKMPLLSEPQTKRLLQMLQSAFRQWNVADEHCKQLFVCQMYRQVSSNGVTPDLELFKEALLHILERGGQRRAGRAAEHLLAEYEHYFAAARMGMKQDNCESHYSRCGLSLYPANDGFKSDRNTAVAKKTAAKDSPSMKTSE